jgi:Membrane bound FAD containing D-sorbitol dehydrogenase
MTEVSRRAVLAGMAATAATAAFTSVVPLQALAHDKPEVEQIPADDLKAFVGLSEKLTGIPAATLAPGLTSPGVDPFEIASVYFNTAMKVQSFDPMIQAFKAASTDETVATFMKDPKTLYLCRSIILAWYLGAWYVPETLEAEAMSTPEAKANKLSATGKPPAKRYNMVQCTVISPKTYSQGWVWRIAQAHPMGYANSRFGYWSGKPPDMKDFIS